MYDRNTEKEELWLHFKWDIKKADRATNEAHRVTPNKLLDPLGIPIFPPENWEQVSQELPG